MDLCMLLAYAVCDFFVSKGALHKNKKTIFALFRFWHFERIFLKNHILLEKSIFLCNYAPFIAAKLRRTLPGGEGKLW